MAKKKKKKKARKFHAIQLYKKKIGKRKFLCPTPTFLILWRIKKKNFLLKKVGESIFEFQVKKKNSTTNQLLVFKFTRNLICISYSNKKIFFLAYPLQRNSFWVCVLWMGNVDYSRLRSAFYHIILVWCFASRWR